MRLFILLGALIPFIAQAQEVPRTSLRYDEDWSKLPADQRTGWLQAKYLELDRQGDIHLTLGAEMRARFESFGNRQWGHPPAPGRQLRDMLFSLIVGRQAAALAGAGSALAAIMPSVERRETTSVDWFMRSLLRRADPFRDSQIRYNQGDGELWEFNVPGERSDRTRSIRVRTRLSVNSAAASIDAALRGGGLIRARPYQVADPIKAGRLVRLLANYEAPPVPVQLVFPAERARKAAVRAFIDYILPALRRELAAIEKSTSA
jgi:hypothetical protein